MDFSFKFKRYATKPSKFTYYIKDNIQFVKTAGISINSREFQALVHMTKTADCSTVSFVCLGQRSLADTFAFACSKAASEYIRTCIQ